MKSVLTWTASCVWSTLSAAARAASRAGLLSAARLEAGRVIGVGNLVSGGAGKTPLVALIARQAEERGLSVCILCRGYRSEWESRGGVLRPGEPAPDAELCGDEAALLRELAPAAWIAVGAQRVEQYERARAAHGRSFDLVVLDDAFQHWKIHQDLRIVALTSRSRAETLYRDFSGALKHADLVVWTKGESAPRTAGRPSCRVSYALAPASGSRDLWLVTGVADNASVRSLAEAAGYVVKRQISFRDHARYDESMVRSILDGAREARARVAVTGKDWVKWRKWIPQAQQASILVLEPELRFLDGQATWDASVWGSASSRA